VTRPIPINQVGLQPGRRFHAQAYVPAWGFPQPAAPLARAVPNQIHVVPEPGGARQESWTWAGLLLLGVSGLTGGLAVVSSLGLWPALAANGVGLDDRGAFYLLAGGVYLLATTLYAAGRTRLLQNLSRAPWDARLMAYSSMGIGGAVSAGLVLVALAIVALLLLLIALAVLMLNGMGGRSGD
jgi:hypothetical protein